jgi:hypothetical protein
VYHPSSCTGRGRPKVKDRIVTTFSLPCTTYLLPWAFLVQHNWMGGTRQGESRYYSIFYLGRSSSSTTGWGCTGRGRPKVKDRIVTTFSLPCTTHPVVPRPAQLDGWYTAGRKSLLFYLLPWAFLVQHNKVKDRIVRTFSLPCTTHPVVLDEERPRKKIE